MPGRKSIKNNYRPNPIPRYGSYKEEVKRIKESFMTAIDVDQLNANILLDTHEDITKFCKKFIKDVDPVFVLNLVYRHFKAMGADTEVGIYRNVWTNRDIPLVWLGKSCLDKTGSFDTLSRGEAPVDDLNLIMGHPKSYNKMMETFEEAYLKPRLNWRYPTK